MRIDTTPPPGRPLPPRNPPPDVPPALGLRRLRHLSNWTLAAMVAGVGATTVLVDHAATSHPAPTAISGTSSNLLGTSTAAPRQNAPVATTTASGVAIASTGGSSASSTAGSRTVTQRGDS
jgi:hypothetical protein